MSDTPQSTPFLTILQHLLRIDPKESLSEIIWEVSEKLVHKAVLLEKKEYADKLVKLGEREIARSVASLRGRADTLASTPRVENGRDILTPRSELATTAPGNENGTTGNASRKMGVAEASCVSESVQSHTESDGILFSKPSSTIMPPSSLSIPSLLLCTKNQKSLFSLDKIFSYTCTLNILFQLCFPIQSLYGRNLFRHQQRRELSWVTFSEQIGEECGYVTMLYIYVMSLLLLKILLMTILIFSFLKRLVDAVIENEENKRK